MCTCGLREGTQYELLTRGYHIIEQAAIHLSLKEEVCLIDCTTGLDVSLYFIALLDARNTCSISHWPPCLANVLFIFITFVSVSLKHSFCKIQ